MSPVNLQRVEFVREGRGSGRGPVVYWMSRDQRVRDNWALEYARELALERKTPLAVAFCLTDGFLGATWRQYSFMLGGLREVERDLGKMGISFHLLRGEPASRIPGLVREMDAAALVADFDPLRIKREWVGQVAGVADVPFFRVDAHNIVPCRAASDKREFGAYTLRPKLRRLLPEFLEEFPRSKRHPFGGAGADAVDWEALERSLKMDRSVPPVKWARPGEKAAARALGVFLERRLGDYARSSNDPVADVGSRLSPYLHFGQLSAARVALEAQRFDADIPAQEAFLEQLIVRRELSDNFCFHEPAYDSCEAFPAWAHETLERHRHDERPYLYSFEEFEEARTADPLWNAAQSQMVETGYMHGYMRMYWAKKILEWTESPEEALRTAVLLNDRYQLDGRDPNGYAGIAWSIGGVHDRAWGEREIFGKVRYMSAAGARRKFDVGAYVEMFGG